MTDFY